MSDKSDSTSEHRTPTVETTADSELLSIEAIENVLVNEREGLPRSYRMRADRHYVDQLASSADGQPVRMIPVNQIDTPGTLPQSDLRLLIESIRSHGVVHPLLVRRRNARYAVIAGRKRLAVAQMLRLATVPCLVHDVDDVQAAALETADNVQIAAAPHEAPASTNVAVHRLVAEHLGTARTCIEMSSRGGTVVGRSVIDLAVAHTWRAARLVDALDLIAGASFASERERAISTLVDEVIDGFAAECRLNDITLRAHIREDLSSSGLNGRELVAGLSGALLATLPIVERSVRPTVVLKASNSASGALALELTQSDAAVSDALARRFFDDDPAADRPGGHAAVAGAMAAKALAERNGGTASFEAVNNGSRLTLVLGRRS